MLPGVSEVPVPNPDLDLGGHSQTPVLSETTDLNGSVFLFPEDLLGSFYVSFSSLMTTSYQSS